MKKLILLTAAFLFTALTGTSAQETRTLDVKDSYEEINLTGSQNVFFQTGPAGEPVTVIGNQADLDNLEIKVNGNTLNIGFRKGYRSKSNKMVQVYVKNPVLKKATVAGSGSVNIDDITYKFAIYFSVSGSGAIYIGRLECEKLGCAVSGSGAIACRSTAATEISAQVSGSGNIELDKVYSSSVDAHTNGSGNIVIKGNSHNAKYTTTGSGNIDAKDLEAAEVVTKVSGSGNISCRCTGEFYGNVSGSGIINLYGEPEAVNFTGVKKRLRRH